MYTLKVTAANIHDAAMMPELLTGQEENVHGDSGYLGAKSAGMPLCGTIKTGKSKIGSIAACLNFSLRFVPFDAKQMIDASFHGQKLPHLIAGLAMIGVSGFFLCQKRRLVQQNIAFM